MLFSLKSDCRLDPDDALISVAPARPAAGRVRTDRSARLAGKPLPARRLFPPRACRD